MTGLATIDRPVPTRSREALPAWPVLVLPWGLPLLWLTGLTVPVAAVLTAVMIGFLSRCRDLVIVPPVLALWGLVVWAGLCGLVVDDVGRLVGWAFRLAILTFVATCVLYVLNAPRVSRARVLSALTASWVTAIVGGWLGLLAPGVRVPTPVSRVLPSSLLANDYVRDLVMPPTAEVQRPWGAVEAFVRPAAPFPYANSWGMAVLVLTPVAIAGAMLTRSLVRRVVVVVGCVALVPPAVATSNRTMFLALAGAAVYVVVRLSFRDRAVPALLALVAGVAVLPFLVGSVLSGVSARASYGSAQGRWELYAETVRRVLLSPVLGYGAPRPSQDVPGLSVGTQGQLWAVLFSYGVVGLGFFLAFLWGSAWLTARGGDDVDVVLHAALLAVCVAIVTYGLDVVQLLSTGLVVVLLLRRRHGLEGPPGEA